MKWIKFLLLSNLIFFDAIGQAVDPLSINNLVFDDGYKPGEYGAIPAYSKTGNGKQTLILIPGLGFDASVFDDFIEANKSNYCIYGITIPGYDNTKAPALPSAGTSFGEQNWNKSMMEGLIKMMEKEKIIKPVIVGHFVQGTQLALRMAIDYPGKVGGVVIIGGPAKFILIANNKPLEFPLAAMVAYTDTSTAPKWFKAMSRRSFDAGNYLPGIYSLDSVKAVKLWNQPASVPLPVMIHYLCEFIASDIKLELYKIKCPVLVLRATFNQAVIENQINNYVKPQFIDSWNNVSKSNRLITVKDINGTGAFIWKDKPGEVYDAIRNFVAGSLNEQVK